MTGQEDAGKPTVAVTGASGLIGRPLCAALAAQGYRLLRLVRRPAASPDEVQWDPQAGRVDAARLEGVEGVVHLAGESVAAGRWTAARKEAIRRSRVEGTQVLCRALAGLRSRPKVLISTSAIGYYGHRGEEPVTEDSAPGSGFLAEVCQAWEAAAAPAREAGIRVVHPRIGMVLSSAGGALARMLPPFKAGLGGIAGSGLQYISWIELGDLVRALLWLLVREECSGPVNAVAPEPVVHRDFVRTLGRLLGRPTLVPMPALAVRLAFGEMGVSLLLEGARVLPARLEAGGFEFRHPRLEGALRAALGSGPAGGP